MFFSERPECWKGHGLHKNRSKRSPCYSVRSLPSMLSLTLIHSLSFSFSLSPCSPPLIISVVRLLIFHSSSLHLYFCSSRSSLWMHSTDLKLISCAVDLKKKEISSEITTMLHVNLPRPHHRCRANWGCHEKKLSVIDVHFARGQEREALSVIIIIITIFFVPATLCVKLVPASLSLFVSQTCFQAQSTALAFLPWKVATRVHQPQWTPGRVSELCFVLHCKKPVSHSRMYNTEITAGNRSITAGSWAHLLLYV